MISHSFHLNGEPVILTYQNLNWNTNNTAYRYCAYVLGPGQDASLDRRFTANTLDEMLKKLREAADPEVTDPREFIPNLLEWAARARDYEALRFSA